MGKEKVMEVATVSELYVAYGRWTEMVKGTPLESEPWKGVKLIDKNGYRVQLSYHPYFPTISTDATVSIAVFMLEGRPVFIGDEVVDKCTGEVAKVTVASTRDVWIGGVQCALEHVSERYSLEKMYLKFRATIENMPLPAGMGRDQLGSGTGWLTISAPNVSGSTRCSKRHTTFYFGSDVVAEQAYTALTSMLAGAMKK